MGEGLSAALDELRAGGRKLWGLSGKAGVAGAAHREGHDRRCAGLRSGPGGACHHGLQQHRTLPNDKALAALAAPGYLLKIIPHVDGSPRICERVRYFCEDITMKGTREGPAALELLHHALAHVATLPVLEIISDVHILLGTVLYDYLDNRREPSCNLKARPPWSQGRQAASARKLLSPMREGAKVAIADLNLDAANGTAAEIRDAGGQALGIAMDVANEDQVKAGVDAVVSKWGGVDILVSNAGIQIVHLIEEFSYALLCRERKSKWADAKRTCTARFSPFRCWPS